MHISGSHPISYLVESIDALCIMLCTGKAVCRAMATMHRTSTYKAVLTCILAGVTPIDTFERDLCLSLLYRYRAPRRRPADECAGRCAFSALCAPRSWSPVCTLLLSREELRSRRGARGVPTPKFALPTPRPRRKRVQKDKGSSGSR